MICKCVLLQHLLLSPTEKDLVNTNALPEPLQTSQVFFTVSSPYYLLSVCNIKIGFFCI